MGGGGVLKIAYSGSEGFQDSGKKKRKDPSAIR